MKIFVLLLFFFVLINCKKETSTALSPQHERFVQVYVELLKLKERLPPQHPSLFDSSQVILTKYRFTKEEYDRSVAYFNDTPERWEAFYQEVLEQLKTEVNRSSEAAPR
jgi:hypothetical protein